MNYYKIKEYDISNGPGVRVSLFVSGCNHKCAGCFNPETWSFNAGQLFDQKALDKLIVACGRDFISGLSILGGEPLDPRNIKAVNEVIIHIKQLYPDINIWLWTGYTFEYIRKHFIENNELCLASYYLSTLNLIDVIVDGPFIEGKKDLSLQYAGSSNQRVIKRSDMVLYTNA